MTITIRPSSTADTRTCDFAAVDRATLLESSRQHIGDVRTALRFFGQMVERAAACERAYFAARGARGA